MTLSTLLFILMTFLAFNVLIIIHEFGHLLFAVWGGMKVKTFSVGLGKGIWGFHWKGIRWQIGMIPLGGFCAVEGEDYLRKGLENPDTVPTEGSLFAAHPFKRILFAIGGPLGNFLIAIIIFAGASMIFMDTTYDDNRIFVFDRTEEVLPAEEAGLQDGDRFITINGNPIENFEDITKAITSSKGQVNIEFLREGIEGVQSVEITAQEIEGAYRIGIMNRDLLPGAGPFEALGAGFISSVSTTVNFTIELFRIIFAGQILENLGTPISASVQIGSMTEQSFSEDFFQGLYAFLILMGNISLILMVANLLPIPGLDGGWILLFLSQWITGLPKKAKSIVRYQITGVILLVIFGVFAVVNDVFFFAGQGG
jgi:regulator of sigma E protease